MLAKNERAYEFLLFPPSICRITSVELSRVDLVPLCRGERLRAFWLSTWSGFKAAAWGVVPVEIARWVPSENRTSKLPHVGTASSLMRRTGLGMAHDSADETEVKH